MATLPLICFDASPTPTCIGIGIYDKTNNVEISHKFNIDHKLLSDVQTAETMALICTLRYLHENNMDGAHLFTDSSNVANRGISPKLLQKYKLDPHKTTLNWIPRQFNNSADYASRKQLVYKAKVTKVKAKVKTSKKSESSGSSGSLILLNLEVDTIEGFRNTYSYTNRLALLQKLAVSEYQRNLVNQLINRGSEWYNPITHYDALFLKLCAKIISGPENKLMQLYIMVKSPKQRQLPYIKIIEILKNFSNGSNIFTGTINSRKQ
jgi:ribonuclease HI